MTRKVAPPRIEVAAYAHTNTDNHGLFYWTAEPQWAAPTKQEAANGRFIVTRTTTNRPMVRVYLDHTFNGTDCRWTGVTLKQTKKVVDPNGVSFGDNVRVDDDTAPQFACDWAKIKALIANDPNYGSLIKTVDKWTAANAGDD